MINKKVNIIAQFADKAFDESDVETLKSIADDCLLLIDTNEFTNLEKAILAYHGATSYSNFIGIRDRGLMKYFGKNTNEVDFEFCIYLYRKSLEYFGKFDLDNEKEETIKLYYSNYKMMAYTNYANTLYETGRLILSIDSLKIGMENNFPMAIANLASKIKVYADYEYDNGHKCVLYKNAYKLLLRALENKTLHNSAMVFFEHEKEWIEKHIIEEYLNEGDDYNSFPLGNSIEEIEYRTWCKNNVLFLNTLNDAFNYSIVANDIIHLPSIVTKIDEGPKYHGLFNQLKQEYASARYMIYEAVNIRETHFSDNEVYMVNTLDYPVYGLGIEKMKYAYRALYSLFDRIAFFLNDYFELGIQEKDVSYKSVWQGEKKGKNGYKFNYDLKEKMIKENEYNYPLIGLYWLFKDISKKKIKHNYLAPEIEEIALIRNYIEHRYFKIVDYDVSKWRNDDFSKDSLAKIITFDEFKNATMKLIKYARESIILLSLSVHCEEKIRARMREKKEVIVPMDLYQYEDEWKQIF